MSVQSADMLVTLSLLASALMVLCPIASGQDQQCNFYKDDFNFRMNILVRLRNISSTDPIQNISSEYYRTPYFQEVAAGESRSGTIVNPIDGQEIKPARHMFLIPGKGKENQSSSEKVGEIAIAHHVVSGQVIRRESLQTVWVESGQKFKMIIGLETFDANGRRIEETQEMRREKGTCRRCHAFNESTGEFYASAPDFSPMLDLPLSKAYKNRAMRDYVPVEKRSHLGSP